MDAALQGLAAVPGVDAAQGLEAIGGQVHVYRRLLRRFVELHGDDGVRLCALLQQGQAAQAAALAHRLRGGAVTLGLVDVETAARALEDALPDHAAASAAALAQHLARTLHDLRRQLLPVLAEPAPAPR